MSLSPIVRRSVVDLAVEALQAQIFSGALSPGDKLPTESALAAALGVGRSTVREAVSRLASSRLIQVHHGGAKIVLDYREHVGLEMVPSLLQRADGSLDLEVARSLVELRNAVAVDAAVLAAGRASEEERRAIVEAAVAMGELQGLDALVEGCLDFWRVVLEGAHNIAYRLALNSVRTAPAGDVAVFRQLIAPELNAAAAYGGLADAISRQDAVAARSAAQALIRRGAEPLFAAIAMESP